MLATILVPLDGSALAARALPYAATIARATGSSILLVHVTSDLATPQRPQVELDAAIDVERLAEELCAQGLSVSARTVAGDAPEGIAAASQEAPAHMIVMSTHGRSGLGRWLYGSVAEDVLRQTTVPVLLISAACDHPWPVDRPIKMMVPLDGSATSETALTAARDLGRALQASLTLVRIVDPHAAPGMRFNASEMHLERASPDVALGHAQDYLDEIASQARASFASVDTLVDVKPAAAGIAAMAHQERIDVIIMATHGRTGLARLTMGSVALATVHRARVPVLLVRPMALERQEAASVAHTARA